MTINENIMLDLETLSSKPNAAIVSIGATMFSKDGLGSTFYTVIRPESAEKFGHISGATFAWWTQQSAEARAMFKAPQTLDFAMALHHFAEWVRTEGTPDTKVWGNGSDFDNVILANGYDALDADAPWKFYNNRCFRTLKNLIPREIYEDLAARNSLGEVKHNALSDAVVQAKIAIDILHIINK